MQRIQYDQQVMTDSPSQRLSVSLTESNWQFDSDIHTALTAVYSVGPIYSLSHYHNDDYIIWYMAAWLSSLKSVTWSHSHCDWVTDASWEEVQLDNTCNETCVWMTYTPVKIMIRICTSSVATIPNDNLFHHFHIAKRAIMGPFHTLVATTRNQLVWRHLNSERGMLAGGICAPKPLWAIQSY
jgi:hypothetical protein